MGEISVVINVVDEEVKSLPRALASIETLADEIVIVDTTSNGTGDAISSENKDKVKVFKHKRVPYIELVRNFGIEKATNRWVLVLDPDEEISPTLTNALKKIASNKISRKDPSTSLRMTSDYYIIPRKNVIFGKWMRYSRWWPDYNVRFFKRGKVSFSEEIHSPPLSSGRGMDLPAEEKYAIFHHHYNSIEQFIERMNRYTNAQANIKAKSGYKFIWTDLLGKPASEFMSRYFAGQGYKDGLHGLAVALLQAVSELVLYLKLWQKKGFKEEDISLGQLWKEVSKHKKDFKWWMLQSFISNSPFVQKNLLRIYRKLFVK